LKFRSVSNIVIAPANTGNANNNKNVVIKILQENNDIISIFIYFGRIEIIEDKKFNDLIIDEAPAKCKDKIVKSTEVPE
jgi:hypothetical protein